MRTKKEQGGLARRNEAVQCAAMTNHLMSGFPAWEAGSRRRFIEKPDGLVITYGQAHALSGRMANVLVSLGVRPGDRVAVQVDKSAEALLLDLACVRAGAVLLPLNTDYKIAEVDYFVGDAEPSVLVCSPAKAAEFEALAQRHGAPHVLTLGADGTGTLLDLARDQPEAFADVERGAGDPTAQGVAQGQARRRDPGGPCQSRAR